ncbi:MAG: nucleotidyltransferase domain-containing protein [Planctomycetota bacterium]|jgi:predicted nucleotidyltransferase
MDKSKLLKEIKNCLDTVYGKRLKGVILYGSFARNEESEHSDIDVMVLLDKIESLSIEARKSIKALYPLTLKYEHPVQPKIACEESYNQAIFPLYKTIHEEGIPA